MTDSERIQALEDRLDRIEGRLRAAQMPALRWLVDPRSDEELERERQENIRGFREDVARFREALWGTVAQ